MDPTTNDPNAWQPTPQDDDQPQPAPTTPQTSGWGAPDMNATPPSSEPWQTSDYTPVYPWVDSGFVPAPHDYSGFSSSLGQRNEEYAPSSNLYGYGQVPAAYDDTGAIPDSHWGIANAAFRNLPYYPPATPNPVRIETY